MRRIGLVIGQLRSDPSGWLRSGHAVEDGCIFRRAYLKILICAFRLLLFVFLVFHMIELDGLDDFLRLNVIDWLNHSVTLLHLQLLREELLSDLNLGIVNWLDAPEELSRLYTVKWAFLRGARCSSKPASLIDHIVVTNQLASWKSQKLEGSMHLLFLESLGIFAGLWVNLGGAFWTLITQGWVDYF